MVDKNKNNLMINQSNINNPKIARIPQNQEVRAEGNFQPYMNVNNQIQQNSNPLSQVNNNINYVSKTNLITRPVNPYQNQGNVNYPQNQGNINYQQNQGNVNYQQNLGNVNYPQNQGNINYPNNYQNPNIPNQNPTQILYYNINLFSQYINEGIQLKDQFSYYEALEKFTRCLRLADSILPQLEDKGLKEKIEFNKKVVEGFLNTTKTQIENQFGYKPKNNFGFYFSKQEEKIDYLECLREKKEEVKLVSSVTPVQKDKTSEVKPTPQETKSDSSVPDDLKSRILNEILDSKPNVSFNDIIGLSQAKQILKEIIVLPALRPELFTGLRTPPRGLLLFGPPGTGKTMIAKAVATECKCTFFSISASSLTSKYLGESEKLVRGLFNIAFEKQPSIIFIDEIDSILSKRTDGENDAVKRLKTEFLIQFDGVGSDLSGKVLVIGATNRPFELDNAVLRRLPKRIYIRQFNSEERVEFMKEIMKKAEHSITDEEFKQIGNFTESYSNSDLKELCREAAYEPIRDISNFSDVAGVDKLRTVVYADFIKAGKNIRGTLTSEVLKELESWNNNYGAI